MPIGGWFWFRRLHGALEQLTQKKWESAPLDSLPRQLGRIPFPDWPVVAVIGESQASLLRHCIVIIVKANIIHDPGLTHAVPIVRYNRREWWVHAIYQPLAQALD